MTNNKSTLFGILLLSVIISLSIISATQLPVTLGTAGDFTILSQAGISTTGTTSITGDIGVSPIDHTAITGNFALMGVPATDTFLTSALVSGKIYSANLVPPTPSKMTTAVSDMYDAYTEAQGRTNPDATELYVGDLSGKTLTPGLYKWSSGVLINAGSVTGDPNGITLDCSLNPDGVFIFQIAQDLTLGSGAKVTLIDCNSDNIFWAIDGGAGAEIGTTAHIEGNILTSKAIHLRTGATLNGRALSQTAVTLDANIVTIPTSSQAYTQADFKAFDGVNITPVGTNFYTVSSSINATYINGTGTESNPVLLKLTGYAPIVTPWFMPSWTTYNYVTIGIKLPTGFTGTRVYSTGVMQYTADPNGIYVMGAGSTDLATTGDALHYLDFSFGANKVYVKNGLVFLKVIWTVGGSPEYFTIDVNDLRLVPVPMGVSYVVPVFTAGTEADFTVTTIANNDAGTNDKSILYNP